MLTPGAVVEERYVVERLLGSGGMADVWVVRHRVLGTRRALKVLRTGDPTLRGRLLAEGRIQAALEHPNVLAVIDVIDVEGAPALLLPLVDGRSLDGALREARPTPAEAAGLLRGIVAGVAFAHDNGVIHRDLKPANVLLAVEPEGLVPRVADFGIARALAGSGGDTLGGLGLGTPGYAAPEQLDDARSAGAAADWWAVGVIAYELLTGRRPFAATGLVALLAQQRAGEFAAPAGGGAAWTSLLRALLEPEPHRRLADAASIDAALVELGAGRGPVAGRLADHVRGRAQATASGVGEHVDAAPSPRLRSGRYARLELAPDGTRRGLDPCTGRRVSLVPLGPAPDLRTLRALLPLSHPHLLPIIDVLVHEAVEVVVDVLDGATDLVPALAAEPRAVQMEAVGQLLLALAHLHRAGITPSLGPGQVLVTHGGVRVLALDRPGSPPVNARVAPEVLAGAPVTVAANVYTVGALAYELLTGRPPYPGTQAAEIVRAQLRGPRPPLDEGLDDALRDFLTRALDPEPTARFAGAVEALAALSQSPAAPVAESARVREGVLQGSGCLGRESERLRLREALAEAGNRRPSTWLVGGESGVGKSRLLVELQAEAWVTGVRVVRGRADRDAASPYAVWRGALAGLVREVEPTAEEWAGLAPALPEGDGEGGGERPRGARSPQAAAPDRLARAVVSLLERAHVPTLLVLDDLHWAGEADLVLLAEVTRAVRGRHLLVGAWRDDEAPELPAQVPGAHVLPLARLDLATVRSLCAGMTGAEPAPELVEWLYAQTGGNALFLVEALRELAQESGGLARVDASALPPGLRTPRIVTLLARRLGRVAPEDRDRLALAAVIGRRLDPELLAALTGRDGLAEALSRLERGAIVDRAPGELRFTHDTLREAVLAGLEPERRRALSAAVARALEPRGEAEPGVAAAIAHHWQQAGDTAAEARWRRLAGEHALALGADADAVRHLERALALAVPTRPLDEARLRRLLGEALYARGHFTEASAQLETALTLLGHRLPASPAAWIGRLLTNLFVQVLHRVRTPAPPADPDAAAALREATAALGRWNNIWLFRGRPVEYLTVSLVSVNVADRAGEVSPGGAGALALATSLLGISGQAAWYSERALAWCRTHGAWGDYAEIQMHLASVAVGRGDLPAARALAEESLANARRTGSRQREALSNGVVGICSFMEGNHEDALRRATENVANWREVQGAGMRLGHLTFQAEVLRRLGRGRESIAALEAGREYQPPYDLLSRMFVLSHLPLLYADEGRYLDAERAAEAARAYVEREGLSPTGLSPYLLASPADALVACVLDARRRGDPREPELLATAQLHAKRLRTFAKTFPVAVAASAWVDGMLARHRQDFATAERRWREGAASAERIGLRFELHRIQLLLSTLPTLPDAERASLRAQGSAGLEAIGSGWVVAAYSDRA